MKAVRKGKEVKYVSNEEAAELVKQGWRYCGKYEWKRWVEKQEEEKCIGLNLCGGPCDASCPAERRNQSR